MPDIIKAVDHALISPESGAFSDRLIGGNRLLPVNA